MNRNVWVSLLLVALAGCASTQEILDKGQPAAMQTALGRARFEMGCPDAKGQVLSRTLVQAPFTSFHGPMNSGPTGVDLVEYTVGVEGCGQRMTQVAVCGLDGTGCYSTQKIP
jgi:hypothetical protein